MIIKITFPILNLVRNNDGIVDKKTGICTLSKILAKPFLFRKYLVMN